MTLPPLFKSFFLGGFECADQINRHGDRVNLLKVTQHDLRVSEDYRLLRSIGMRTVREGICWSEVEKVPGQYDFAEVLNRMEAAEEYGIQQIWDLIHFGYPDGLFPTHPHFAPRFENLCRAFAQFYRANTSKRLWVVPVNEISFLSWYSGEAKGTVPYSVNNGWEIKYHLCKAALQGIRALKEIDPSCKIVMVEPLVKIHCNGINPESLYQRNQYQFEAMDIIGGRMCPELGGDESYLEVLGFNYYWNCQWKGEAESLSWPDLNEERTPLNELLQEAYLRYGKPMLLSETGHFGEGREEWLEEISRECLLAIERGVDLQGICIYPVTDRPDWDNLSDYSSCGLYDLDEQGNRIPDIGYIQNLKKQQALFEDKLTYLKSTTLKIN